MEVTVAGVEDADRILSLQKLAYQTEAAIYNDYRLPPLVQTIEEMKEELGEKVFLKTVLYDEIIGSVRGHSDGRTCFIGRLIVHPNHQRKSIGTRLMQAIEERFPDVQRYELFTGNKSADNIRLYNRLGYYQFKEESMSEKLTLVFMEKLNKA
jgi:GNAT superfamily N-acetyltransferase